jgi:hypothetical protein
MPTTKLAHSGTDLGLKVLPSGDFGLLLALLHLAGEILL